MGRSRRLLYENIHFYDKLHTKKPKLYNGVTFTVLYLVKETEQFFMSTEVWSHCCTKFKAKKPFTLSVNIPVVEDQTVIDFLNKHYSKTFLEKYGDKSDNKEAISYLDRLYPDKEKKNFGEFNNLIDAYLGGTFIRYKEDGSVAPDDEQDINDQKYWNAKYNRFPDTKELLEKRKKWTDEKDKILADKYCREYLDAEEEYVFEKNNLISVFIELGKNSVVFPVGFKETTTNWAKEKYGKELAYANVGEIYFVVTPEAVFFNLKRHF